MTNTPVSILIVDDEPPLLKLMQAYLQRLGYSAAGFADAGSALTAFNSKPDEYQLVIADLSLPDMTGDAMALRMLSANAALRVLLCSGYPFEVETLPPELRKNFSVLQKPFLPNMLAKSVEDLLNRPI